MKKQKMIKVLIEEFPTARPGLIKVIIDALEIHSKKNNDYNGKKTNEKFEFETISKFCDIRRKYSRLHNIFTKEVEPKVDEKLTDTVLDLGVYSFLFLEHLNK